MGLFTPDGQNVFDVLAAEAKTQACAKTRGGRWLATYVALENAWIKEFRVSSHGIVQGKMEIHELRKPSTWNLQNLKASSCILWNVQKNHQSHECDLEAYSKWDGYRSLDHLQCFT